MTDDATKSLAYQRPDEAERGKPYLEVVSGLGEQRRVPIEGNGFVIGRAPTAGLRIDTDGVSRKHAKIVPVGRDAVNLIDLDSRNGTFVNGRRVDVAGLREGDEIQVGLVVLRFGFERPMPRPSVDEPSESPRERPSLSARELEVARLVAEGLTNAEVGKRLNISPRTVATHLTNIYERLGIHSRAALARHVIQHELDGG